MIYTYKITKEYWTVYKVNEENSIVYGQKGGSNQVSTNRDNFVEFDTEEELADYLGTLTGDANWYWDRKNETEIEQ